MLSKRKLQDVLEEIAPLNLAGSWDNVGMLIDTSQNDTPITGICLTIDLTESVLREALDGQANFIIAYHPILFGGVKRLHAAQHAHRVVIESIQNNISVFSPHTALDAVSGGVTDWLLEKVAPLASTSIIEPDAKVPNAGMGRVGTLRTPTRLTEVLDNLKKGLGLKHLRVSVGLNQAVHEVHVKRVAVCPGAGGSVVSLAKGHDCIVTGEMRHHDVLYAQSKGITTILTEHTNCERGFLPVFKDKLVQRLGSTPIFVAQSDRDPLDVY